MPNTGILPPLQYSWRNLSSPTRPSPEQLAIHAIRFGSMPETKNIGRGTIMVYLNLSKLEYSLILKTWKRALHALMDRLALPGVEVHRASPTDERLLLVFPDAAGAMVLEKEFDDGIEVVPGGWTWETNPIPSSMVQATGITQLKLMRPLGRSFFHQVIIPRLLQLFAPGTETSTASDSSRLWGKITSVQPERCSGDSRVDYLIHKYMVYHMAKIALERTRSGNRSEMDEEQLVLGRIRVGEAAKLQQDSRVYEQHIWIGQMAVENLWPVTGPSAAQIQQYPEEEYQPPPKNHGSFNYDTYTSELSDIIVVQSNKDQRRFTMCRAIHR
ncbi:hypothetical protein Q9L58_009256 [Maublancomyces gigas]|uniref:Uncharacterized protein n=1 Tax=Discina gigas TaxID=1032678 RepID=A0ABR3G8G6_9PEZI